MEPSSQEVCDSVLRFLDRFKHIVQQLAEQQGLTRMQIFALHCIEHEGETTMGKVADTLHCDASNVTGIVDRLVSQGLVVRTENAQDRRAKTLQLTDKGREVVRTIREHLPERIGCDKLTNAERGDLLTILQKLGA